MVAFKLLRFFCFEYLHCIRNLTVQDECLTKLKITCWMRDKSKQNQKCWLKSEVNVTVYNLFYQRWAVRNICHKWFTLSLVFFKCTKYFSSPQVSKVISGLFFVLVIFDLPIFQTMRVIRQCFDSRPLWYIDGIC